MYTYDFDGKKMKITKNTDGSPEMMSKNTYAQSVNGLVLYKDLLDYEVQKFEINLLQFTEIKKDKWETS